MTRRAVFVALAVALSLGSAAPAGAQYAGGGGGGGGGTSCRGRSHVNTTEWKDTTFLGPWGGSWMLQRKISSNRELRRVSGGCATFLVNEVCSRAKYQAGPVTYHKALGCSTTAQRI